MDFSQHFGQHALVARSRWICVPDYLLPVNHLGVWFLDIFRRLGGRLAALFSSKFFDLLLNGDEVKAALGGTNVGAGG
jgi:hypothetical protein